MALSQPSAVADAAEAAIAMVLDHDTAHGLWSALTPVDEKSALAAARRHALERFGQSCGQVLRHAVD